MSSLLKGGSSHTELALAMRQSSLVVKWMEGVVRGYKPDAHTIVTTAERKHPCPFRIMVLHLFCNQDTAVRFCQGAPIYVVSLVRSQLVVKTKNQLQ